MKLALREDGSVVYLDPNHGPYHVVSKDLDPYNKYDLAEMLAYAKAHPEDVIDEYDHKHLVRTEITQLEQYLASTDWYATRFAETGKAIPVEITTQRNAARERISELRAEE